MRVLCSTLPLEGHVRPVLPLGTALVKAGHDVRVATGLDWHARVREAGLIPVAAGPSCADAFAATAHLSGLGELSLIQRAPATFSRIFAPAKLPDLERIVAEWQPDLVVHECTDLAAPIAAAVAGLRTVTQGWGLVPSPGLTVPEPADTVRRYLWHRPPASGAVGPATRRPCARWSPPANATGHTGRAGRHAAGLGGGVGAEHASGGLRESGNPSVLQPARVLSHNF